MNSVIGISGVTGLKLINTNIIMNQIRESGIRKHVLVTFLSAARVWEFQTNLHI